MGLHDPSYQKEPPRLEKPLPESRSSVLLRQYESSLGLLSVLSLLRATHQDLFRSFPFWTFACCWGRDSEPRSLELFPDSPAAISPTVLATFVAVFCDDGVVQVGVERLSVRFDQLESVLL